MDVSPFPRASPCALTRRRYNPLSLEQFNEHVYFQFYNPNAAPPIDDPLLSHQLALMFMVLAIGSLMDTKRPAYNIEAEKYHQLARAALFQSPIFEEPTINAVQTLYLMAFYLFLSERHGSGVGSRWALMGLAVKLGISVSGDRARIRICIGARALTRIRFPDGTARRGALTARLWFLRADRDAGRWNVESAEINRRRQTFWELYVYDLLQSYTMGRPPSFSLAHIDCKKPFIEDPNNDETFHWWKHRYTSECMHAVYDQAFGAKMPTYNTVLQLDRKLRGFPVPQLLQIAGFGSTDARMGHAYDSVPLVLQRHLVLAIRESNLLYMHRGFFARAISDHAKDPLGSPYGSSFIAAYRSAGSLVALVRNIHSQLKELTERMWFLWTHLFSCSIILGSIVTRCPSMSLAPSALVQLDSACELFSKAAHIFHAEKVLKIMLNLREKAHASLSAYRNTPPSRQGTLSEPTTPADDNDELSTLGGRTRLVAQKEKSVSPVMGELSPTSLNPIVPFPLKSEFGERAHPYVLEYLRTFASHAHVPPPPGHADANAMQQQQRQQQQQQQQPSSPFDTTAFAQDMPMAGPSAGAGMMAGGMSYPQQLSPMEGMPQSLPQYFPVFDYGYVGEGLSGVTTENDISGRSYSPDASMQTAWQDFVAQIGHM
ncbi:hypothetical protein EIP86_009213 [Pleurotus ostreatoroseus]|nr:hypothetical protein EIP86_009213 [Pleurotus ostreatoroseus]